MTFLQRRWLGLTVLALLALTIVTMYQGPHEAFLFFDGLFAIFTLVWMFRGFIRFVGRAFHHSVTHGPK
jgi:hypothetical protein